MCLTMMQPGTNEEMDVGTISTPMYTYGWGWSTPTNLSSVAFWHLSQKREQFWSETNRKKSHSKYLLNATYSKKTTKYPL